MVKFKYPVLSRLNIILLVHEVMISDLDKVTSYNFTKRRPDVPESKSDISTSPLPRVIINKHLQQYKDYTCPNPP